MKKWHELGKELRRFINPDTFPVAVRFLAHESEIPKGVKTPLKDLKVKIAHCQAAAITRKYGWTLVLRFANTIIYSNEYNLCDCSLASAELVAGST